MLKDIIEECANGKARVYTRRQLVRRLLGPGAYAADIPWELDDALYYARLIYPDMSIKEMKTYKENDDYGR